MIARWLSRRPSPETALFAPPEDVRTRQDSRDRRVSELGIATKAVYIAASTATLCAIAQNSSGVFSTSSRAEQDSYTGPIKVERDEPRPK